MLAPARRAWIPHDDVSSRSHGDVSFELHGDVSSQLHDDGFPPFSLLRFPDTNSNLQSVYHTDSFAEDDLEAILPHEAGADDREDEGGDGDRGLDRVEDVVFPDLRSLDSDPKGDFHLTLSDIQSILDLNPEDVNPGSIDDEFSTLPPSVSPAPATSPADAPFEEKSPSPAELNDDEMISLSDIERDHDSEDVPLPLGMLAPANWSDLSLYEKKRRVNIHRNHEELVRLGIEPSKDAGGKVKPLAKRMTRPSSRPVRASKRLSHRPSSYCEEALFSPISVPCSIPLLPCSGAGVHTPISMQRPLCTQTPHIFDTEDDGHEEEADWFRTDCPSSGRLSITMDMLPLRVGIVFASHMESFSKGTIDSLWGTGQREYRGVTPQSSQSFSNKAKRGVFNGWQVQTWDVRKKKIVRLGLTNESEMGGLMMVLADLYYPLTSQKNMYMFLHSLASCKGEEILTTFLGLVEDKMHHVNPLNRKFKGGKATSSMAQTREEFVANSFFD